MAVVVVIVDVVFIDIVRMKIILMSIIGRFNRTAGYFVAMGMMIMMMGRITAGPCGTSLRGQQIMMSGGRIVEWGATAVLVWGSRDRRLDTCITHARPKSTATCQPHWLRLQSYQTSRSKASPEREKNGRE